jgi:membrane protein required for colicin V production
MTGLDIVVLLLIGGLGFAGFRRGFAAEAISIAAWVAGFFAVKLFHAPVSGFLTEKVGTESGAAVLAAALLFGITFGAGKLIASRVSSASKGSAFSPFDRVLGVGFGACKGLLAASLAFLIFSLGYDTIYGGQSERPEWMTASRTYPLLDATARALVDIAGDRQRGGIADGNTPDARL